MPIDQLQALNLIFILAKAQVWAEGYINEQFDNAESSNEVRPGFRATLHALKLAEAETYLVETSPIDADYPVLDAGVGVVNGSLTLAEEAAKVVAGNNAQSVRLAILEKRRLTILARMRNKDSVAEIKNYLTNVNFPAPPR